MGSAIMMYSGYSEMVAPKEPEQPRNSRKVFVGAVVGALALLVVVFAIGQTQDDSVRNLLTATKAYAAPHKVKLAKLTYDTQAGFRWGPEARTLGKLLFI